ncbi:sulfotransferase family 2 domain-containing protein [Salipiger sp. PrR002]|uniref:sulfotransferase family 2 domain-containing protein n=1 Tax=Salipiger sp. PrR002 TaxID=2706489 RepID=UPI0013B8668E|nr:sulfotransferase family 2 domain-containing protein [Salipiger sp. PrR002]NDW01321.1 sulfotransferase family 2 domain-containing protein [Salipiger sp. PrR002]NDW58890.1 sulfotransferase family 2 domain-containing protein [Salipiger sp. PrR004]
MTNTQTPELSREDIRHAYQLFLGRKPNESELDRMHEHGHNYDSIRRTFLNSPEFQKKNGWVQQAVSGSGTTTPEKAKTLIHLHVPKSAGSTLTAILAPTCPQTTHMTVGDNNLQHLSGLGLQRRSELRFIFGHLSHGVARHLPQSCAYITVLRDPGNRLLSYFRYIQRITDHPLHVQVAKKKMSFGDFLEYAADTPEVRLESDNGQVRRLAGYARQIESIGQEEKLFQKALHNIFAEDIVYGFTEYFDDFLERLTKRKIISGHKDTRLNMAPEKTEIAPVLAQLNAPQKELFDQFNYWDNKFYEICKSAYFASDPNT